MLESHESDVRKLEQVLQQADLPAEVRWVADPTEVLFAAEDEAMDIAVLNLELPGVDDVLVEELRMLEGAHRLPIIAFSDTDPDQADHVFPRPREDYEYFGIVHAIRIYWLARAPTMAPPPPPQAPSGRPRRMTGIDVMGLPIKPAEAYLLSMVDGQMDVDEISLSIGSDSKDTRAMLRRLSDLGAVAWRAPHPSLVPPPPPASMEASAALSPPLSEPPRKPPPEAESEPRKAAPPPEAAPGPKVARKSLSPQRKQRIDDAHALLGEADHYELLGVPHDAHKKTIRAAYFELAKLFHTDTLFGVELAEYGRKMDQVFRDITEAYEVLSKNKKRRAYDAYLGAVRETKALDESPTPSLAPPAPPAEPEPLGLSSSRRRARADTASRKRIARELLEKRSGGGPAAVEAPREGAVQALARTLQAVSKSQPEEDRAERLIADADRAEETGNFTGAAEALRIAAAWRPNDEALARRAEELRIRAVGRKAPAYEKRARYAEQNESWSEAALCWMKVCEVRPDDSHAALSAARALTESRGDLKEAALYAKRAIELQPKNAQAQRMLAEVYLAAGMPASARPALKAALALAPKDPKARALYQSLDG